RTVYSSSKSCEPRAVDHADALFGGEGAGGIGDLAGGDVNSLVRFAAPRRFVELAQRLDAGALRLPAPEIDQGLAPAARHLEIRLSARQPAHLIAFAPERRLERRRKRFARHGAQGL